MRNLKAYLLLSFGYLLTYAAVHNSGHFAYRPWEALGGGPGGAASGSPASLKGTFTVAGKKLTGGRLRLGWTTAGPPGTLA